MTENITKISIETCVPLCKFVAGFRSYSKLLFNISIIISPMDFLENFFFFLFKSRLAIFIYLSRFCSIQAVKLNCPSPPGTQCHLCLSFCLSWGAHDFLCLISQLHCCCRLSGTPAVSSCTSCTRLCFLSSQAPGIAICVTQSWLYPIVFQLWHASSSAYLITFLPGASSSPICALHISLLLPYVLLCQLLCLSLFLWTFHMDAVCKTNTLHRVPRIFRQDLRGWASCSGSIWPENKEHKCPRKAKQGTPAPGICSLFQVAWLFRVSTAQRSGSGCC